MTCKTLSYPYTTPAMRHAMDDALRPGGLLSTCQATERMPLPAGSLVLDAGCGPAKTSAWLKDQMGCRVIAMDPNLHLMAPDQKQAPGVSFIRGELGALPLATKCLDAVFCECVLSLTDKPSKALAEIRRVLKPGGLLYYSDMFARAKGRVSCLAPHNSCLAAPADLQTLRNRILENGFALIAEIDQTSLLRQTAGRIIFEYGSLEIFWQAVLGNSDAAICTKQIKNLQPGYVFFIAARHN